MKEVYWGGCGAVGASCALLLFAAASILLCRVECCKASEEEEEAEGRSFYALQVEKARLAKQRHIIANARVTGEEAEKEENTEKTHEENMILIEKLWHRDHISSPWRQETTEFGNDAQDVPHTIQEAISHPGNNAYFARMSIGSKDHSNTLLLDTGAELTWLQCEPCPRCYKPTATKDIFNGADSSSFKFIECESDFCKNPKFSLGCNNDDKCEFKMRYASGASTSGVLVEDTFYIGGYHIHEVSFGCTHETNGYFLPFGSGILGLGGGPYSLPSQTKMNVFYCLPPWHSNSIHGFFGLEPTSSPPNLPTNTIHTHLLSNPRRPNGYFINITGISIDEQIIPINSKSFVIEPNGKGGVLLDSGTPKTRFTPEVFKIFRASFQRAAFMLHKSKDDNYKTLCYDMSEAPSEFNTPTIRVHFGDATIKLPPENVLIQSSNSNLYCLAFAPTFDKMPHMHILGGIQMAGFLVYINRVTSTVGFVANQCNS